MRTLVNLAFVAALNVAYPLIKIVWWILGKDIYGVYVGVWHEGRILVIKNSYKRQYCLPGGMIDKGETPPIAGARELGEEVGITVDAAALTHITDIVVSEGRHNDRAYVMELCLDEAPTVTVDGREVIWATFLTPAEALALPLAFGLPAYIQEAADRHGRSA